MVTMGTRQIDTWGTEERRARRIGRAARLGAIGLATALAALGTAGCGDRAGRASTATAAPDTTLTRMAAELLPSVETLSGLPARGPLNLARRSRAELERYLEEELGEQLPPERASAIVRVYSRLGLVPDTLDLSSFLRALLLEQVVGYYDPRRDTLYVVEGVEPSLVEAVLSHEMVHALQDQYEDLDSLTEANKDRNDKAMAAQAALEGHAALVMLEWQLRSLLGPQASVDDLPELDQLLQRDPLAAAGMQFPELENAPEILREELLFPYLGGLTFARAVRRTEGGAVAPLGDLLPRSTEQVLHPERLLSDPPDEPTAVHFTGPAAGGWTQVYSDGLGELETRVLLRQLLGDRERADAAAEGWDGDRYRLLDSPGGESLVWVSVWDSERDAEEFRAAIAAALARRPGGEDRRVSVEALTISGRPGVRVVDRPAAGEPPPEPVLEAEAGGP